MSDEPTRSPNRPMPPLEAGPASPIRKQRRGSGALVLGVIGTVLAFIPGALYLGIVLGIVALVLGILAWRRRQGRRFAPIAFGGAAIILGSLFAGIYSGASGSSGPSTEAAIQSSPAAAQAAAPAPVSAKPAAPPVANDTTSAKPVAPAVPAKPALTASEEQAAVAAEGYLNDGQGFSHQGLIDQLTLSYGNGFKAADAVAAITSLNVDYNAQAVTAAKGYLTDGQGFSHASLVQQLTSSYGNKFTPAQAQYAATKVGL